MSPCAPDSCGENAECVPENHGIACKCRPGYEGNPYVQCGQGMYKNSSKTPGSYRKFAVLGCTSDSDCSSNEACINRQCGNPCKCGQNAVCEVLYHKANCKCLPGYGGNPAVGCTTPSNPCEPNPCGTNALCEIDNGNPICFCPKGLTGNPFKICSTYSITRTFFFTQISHSSRRR